MPLDVIDKELSTRRIDLALNIHSFSEMSAVAVDGWLKRLQRLAVEWLLIVPNEADRLLTTEEDGSRRPFGPLLESRGYELMVKEPIFPDPTLRSFMGVTDCFLLFRRTRSAPEI